MPTVGKVKSIRKLRDTSKPIAVIKRDQVRQSTWIATIRDSTDHERAVDGLLAVIGDKAAYCTGWIEPEDKLLGLENWAHAVQEQAESVRWTGVLESVGNHQVRRD